MPRRSRRALSAPFFHVINRSVRKVPIFGRSADYRAFLNVLREGLQRHPLRLVSYCVLSNHWHLVVESSDTIALIKFMQWVTATHAIRWHRRHKTVGQGPVYQGRFHSEPLEGAADLTRVCRYVERNALRAGLVARAQDWPWSSLAERLRMDPEVPLVPAAFLASSAWIEYVNTSVTERERIEERIRLGLRNASSGTESPETVENSFDPLEAVPLDDFSDDPGALAEVVQGAEDIVGIDAGADEDEADTHVEGPEHFSFIESSRAFDPGENRRHDPAFAMKGE